VLEKAKGKARKFRGIYKGTDIGFAMHPSAGVEFYNVSMLNPSVTTDDDVVKVSNFLLTICGPLVLVTPM
jgi:hypothetical protein